MPKPQVPKPHSPLSPHLQIYKPQWTSVCSILHRLTGMALCLGYLGLSVWIFMACYYPATAGYMTIIALVLFLTALTYHTLNGVRHLMWDVGKGLDIPCVERSAKVVVCMTACVFVGLVWAVVGM